MTHWHLVADLSKKVYPRKQKTVILHALPLAWSLVTSSAATSASGPLRDATQDFVVELHKLMGSSLFEHAAAVPSNSQVLVDHLRTLINSAPNS